MSKIPLKSILAVPFEPSMHSFLMVLMLPAWMGMTSSNFVFSSHLRVASITCSLMTLLLCGLGYLVVTTSRNDKLAEPSRSASLARQKMGHAQFALRLTVLLLAYGLLCGASFWLAARILGGSIPPFWEISVSTGLVSIIAATGILIQSLALDSHYKRERQTTK